jgi:methylenetetrahydrofolate reductase (NADPH)
MSALNDGAFPPRRLSAADDIAAISAELVACGSLEMGAEIADFARIAAFLPAGTPVYVNHLPRRLLGDALPVLAALVQAGLEPVPHMAARRIASRGEAEIFLQQAVRRAGVRKVMLIGGDAAEPVGPYSDSAALLKERLLVDCGIVQVGLAGYPEGHPRIDAEHLSAALDEKLALAEAQGIAPYVVTQFSFAPTRVVEYCAAMARRAPRVPIYVGLAGPSSPRTLIRYAHRCGVSATLLALQAQGMGAVRLFTHVDPTDQLTTLARHTQSGSASSVVGVHLYAFGGAAATAAWMHARITARTSRP